jgi:LmbE family N-acetylglucosaminyl deacetylase
MQEVNDEWPEEKIILVILAHPDDPEFFCGGTLARWKKAGHKIHYCLITNGNKGTNDPLVTPEGLTKLRREEQDRAAAIIGVEEIHHLGYDDGTLVPDLKARKDVIRVIRKIKPNIIVTCDPTNFFPNDNYINHPDHRAAGIIAIDAVFPAAGNGMFFPELVIEEGLQPHSVKEVWLSLTNQGNFVIDVTEFYEIKINALLEHKSQIGDKEAFIQRMRISKRTSDSTESSPRYEENFRRIIFR